MLFKDIINSLIKIFNEDAYLNLTINGILIQRKNEYSDHNKKVYVRVTSGVVENKLLIDYLLKELISGQRVKPFVKNALRTGVYMISFMNTANHYVVNELVKTVKKQDYRASTFVNAILRRYISEDVYNKGLIKINKLDDINRLSILYSINKELVELLDSQYDDVENILKPNLEKYNTYRINTIKTNIKEVLCILEKDGIMYEINGVTLKTKESLINHPLFENGLLISQDASSIKVSEVASPKEGYNIIDVCSAPGAKSMHLAALINNNGTITSCDIHEHKLRLIEDNAKKLGVTCVNTRLADGKNTKYSEEFDLVLLDVPCSGLGVINHKSDLKYHMTIKKIKEINKLQYDILENMCKYVKTNRCLVYSTCTINKDENERLIEKFLKIHHDFIKKEEHIIVQNSESTDDGFYIVKLERIKDAKRI